MSGYRPPPPPKDRRQRIYWLEHDCEVVPLGGHQPDDGCGICLWYRFDREAPGSVLDLMAQGLQPMGPPPFFSGSAMNYQNVEQLVASIRRPNPTQPERR
jgi:hypothetical protein